MDNSNNTSQPKPTPEQKERSRKEEEEEIKRRFQSLQGKKITDRKEALAALDVWQQMKEITKREGKKEASTSQRKGEKKK